MRAGAAPMSDIFVSYARSSEPQAELVERLLSALGYSVWRDDALPIHRAYPRVIEEQLAVSKAVIVLWSHDGATSDWVRAEADVARQAGKLVQVTVDGTAPPIPFNQIQCASLGAWRGEPDAPAWRAVLSSVASLVGQPDRSPSARGGDAAPLLAVLPFDNVSADAELVYFSDGVSDEILQTVSRARGIRVIGRASSFQFRGRDKAVRRVAQELGCSHVLDGSVRRSGTHIRVLAQLIECEGQTTLWSDRFDRDLTNVFALQDEIAAAVARALELAFAHAASPTQIDPVAFDLYLRAKASVSDWLGANDADLLEQAVARAPGFAQAWAALAVTRATQAQLEHDSSKALPLQRRAVEAVRATLALDPSAGVAYIASGIVEPMCGRFEARDELVARALRLSPHDPVVLFWAFRWSRDAGRLRESLEFIRRAWEVDPLWPQGVHQYATALFTNGQSELAARIWDDALDRWPDLPYLVGARLRQIAVVEDWAGVDAVLVRLGDRPVASMDFTQFVLREVARMRAWGSNDTERLRAALARELDRTGTLRLGLAFACRIGLTGFVYDLLARARFDHLFEPEGRLLEGEWALWTLFARGGEAMRQDRRFVHLCARLGLCDYWVRTERWPDCVDEVAPYYDFRAEARQLAGRFPRGR